MKCTCPKCHAKIELDLPEVTEAGTTALCPDCNARFNVFRESFGGRALRKTSELSCAPCGSELGAQLHCPTCGAQFPDYLVVSLGRKKVRRATTKIKLKSSPLHRPDKAMSQLPSLEMSMKGEPLPSMAAGPSVGKYRKSVTIAVCLLVAVVLAAAGSMYYAKYQEEKEFVRNFVTATYGVQVGTDKSLKAGAHIAADWKVKLDAGESFRPRLSMDDERELGIVHSKIETASANLSKCPEKFSICNEKLAKLRAVYNKAHALILAPGNSLQNFTDISNKIDAEYRQAAKEFKAAMPEEMMDELITASRRYKGLRPLLKT